MWRRNQFAKIVHSIPNLEIISLLEINEANKFNPILTNEIIIMPQISKIIVQTPENERRNSNRRTSQKEITYRISALVHRQEIGSWQDTDSNNNFNTDEYYHIVVNDLLHSIFWVARKTHPSKMPNFFDSQIEEKSNQKISHILNLCIYYPLQNIFILSSKLEPKEFTI